MSRASASTAREGFELECMRVLAPHVGIPVTEDDANESKDAIYQLVNTLMRRRSPIIGQSLHQVLSILEQKNISFSKSLYTIFSRVLSYILFDSGVEEAQGAGFDLLLDLLEETRNSSTVDHLSLKRNIERCGDLHHELILCLHRLFVDGKRELRSRILAGKLLAELLLEYQDGILVPKLGHATLDGIVPMLSRRTDIVLRLFSSFIIQILTTSELVLWSPDKTTHRGIFFKYLNRNTHDPVQSFHAYAKEIEHYFSGTLGLRWLERDAIHTQTCYLLQSVSINGSIVAEGSILAAQNGSHLRIIHTVDRLSTRFFRYIEIPLEFVRGSRCSATCIEEHATRLELFYERSKSILIDGRIQYLDEGSLILISRSDLTVLHEEIQKAYTTFSSAVLGSVTRKPSSILLQLETADDLGRYQECSTPEGGDIASEKDIGPRGHVDYINIQDDLETEDSTSIASRANELVDTERHDIPPRHDTGKEAQTASSLKGSDLFTRNNRAPQPRARDSLILHPRHTRGEFRTPSSGAAADWVEGVRLNASAMDKGDMMGSESSRIMSPSNSRKRKPSPATSPRKRRRFVEENMSIESSEGDVGGRMEGRGQQIGKKLAAAFQKAELPQNTEDEALSTNEMEIPESELGDPSMHEMGHESDAESSVKPVDKKRDGFKESELSQGDAQKDRGVLPLDDLEASLRKTVVDSNGSPRLVFPAKPESIARSESRPVTDKSRQLQPRKTKTPLKSFYDESGYDASTEELSDGKFDSEGDPARSTSVKKPAIGFNWTPVLDAETVEAAYDSRIPRPTYYPEYESPVFSSRCPSIGMPGRQREDENLKRMRVADAKSPPDFQACLREPVGCSCLSYPSRQPESSNKARGTDVSRDQGQQLRGRAPSELSGDADGERLTDSSVIDETQSNKILQAKPLLALHESTEKTPMKTKRLLARELEREREVAGQVLEQYGRDCNLVLDQLLEGQEERIRVCEEQMYTIQKQHRDTCEALIHRLKDDELRIRKRTSLYVTQSLEKRGRKRRVISPGRRTSSADIPVPSPGSRPGREAHHV